MSPRGAIGVSLAGLILLGCGSGTAAIRAAHAARIAHWSTLDHARQPIDVAVGRTDDLPVVAANGGLYLLRPPGRLMRFAPAYRNAAGESYIAVPAARHPGCSFGANNVYAIRLSRGQGITRVTASGRASRFAKIAPPGLIDGIAFDEVGLFHYRLLVTIEHGTTTTVDAISCRGTVDTLTSKAPRVEGGIVVAPKAFGRFGGDLIAPDELTGRIYAITPAGGSRLVATSGLPHGQDIGVESGGFVPPQPRAVFVVADRLTPGNPHPGDNLLLALTESRLAAAGVRPGDLLLASEGGALTDAVRCGLSGCDVRYVANGPSQAHIEGHIGFLVR